ncbi:Flp family type IVb pilin [Halomonas sp. 328]|uniref:Flp family type IVb pilin n=1 Tax=Halomonas sp. 328 TaxID=2776704 RepID=UPI001E327398|nr:Flp family type IVb pilin [Halomonas sp. 328]
MNKLIEKSTELTQRGAVAMRLNRPKFRKQRGASAIEYVVIAAMIVIAIVVFIDPISTAISGIFTELKEAIE